MLARATLTQNDVLERLQQIGVKISIDDFGTKYSSLDYLRTYRVNRLKIPKSLTSTAAQDPESAAMVRAIVGIARELNIEVIAQGVETEREWSFLTATSPVGKVQGYYYSEPVSAERAEELLRGGRLTPGAPGAAARGQGRRQKTQCGAARRRREGAEHAQTRCSLVGRIVADRRYHPITIRTRDAERCRAGRR